MLYEELVTRGYFPRSPEKTRSSWRTGGIVFLIAAIVIGCFGAGLLTNIAPVAWFVVVVLIALATGVIFLSVAMPRKSQAGAEAAAKWRAFRRYLDDIEKYEKVDESRDIFDKYLPFAVAFGLENSWVSKFASVGAATPSWYGPILLGGPFTSDPFPGGGPYGRHGRGMVVAGGGGTLVGGGGHHGGGGIDVPDVQDVSDSAGRSLQRSSDGLLDMFNTAAKASPGSVAAAAAVAGAAVAAADSAAAGRTAAPPAAAGAGSTDRESSTN